MDLTTIIIATKTSTPVLAQIATLLGWLMNGIYWVLEKLLNIHNVGLTIIIFAVIVYLVLTPLTVRQQRMTKMNSVMAPELQAIQKKYKDKKDQQSMAKMQDETNMVYQKYGVSPMGSCATLLIQLPILFSMYQVIYKIPAYVGSVKDIFSQVVARITSVSGYTEIMQNFIDEHNVSNVKLVLENNLATSNSVIDVLYKLSPSQWKDFANISSFSGFADVIRTTASNIAREQYFLGLNIADNPIAIIRSAFAAGSILLVIGAALVPILSWFTNWLNYRLMPQQNTANDDNSTMATSMRSMNMIMPLFSGFICLTLPVGIGIYWISGAVIRTVQMIIINQYMDRVDLDDMIRKNLEKAEKKREKRGYAPRQISNSAHQNVRNVGSTAATASKTGNKSHGTTSTTVRYKEGSLASKANMVQQFNEKNAKNNVKSNKSSKKK